MAQDEKAPVLALGKEVAEWWLGKDLAGEKAYTCRVAVPYGGRAEVVRVAKRPSFFGGKSSVAGFFGKERSWVGRELTVKAAAHLRGEEEVAARRGSSSTAWYNLKDGTHAPRDPEDAGNFVVYAL